MINRYFSFEGLLNLFRHSMYMFVVLLLLIMTPNQISSAELELSEFYDNSVEILNIVGRDFMPNESVRVELTAQFSTGEMSEIFRLPIINTDNTGSFNIDWEITNLPAIPTIIFIEAIGQSSGYRVESAFYNSNTNLNLSIDPDQTICLQDITPELEIEVCATLTENCGGGEEAPLEGREIQFYLNNDGCGVSVGQDPIVTVVTDINGSACMVFTRIDTLELTDELTFRIKFPGESKPTSNESPNSACDPQDRINLAVSNACFSMPIITDCGEDPIVEYDVTPSDSADLYFVRSIDIDRDNFVDIIFTGSVTSGLFIAFGNSSGELDPPVSYHSISQDAFDFGYLNPDTLLDIIAVRGNMTYLLLNEGNRQFSVDSILTSAKEPAANIPSIASGYFNSDPFLDFIKASNLIYLGESDGKTFTEIALPFSFDALETCDFDNSGSEDIVVIKDDSMIIHLNDGDGNFVQSSSIFIGTSTLDLPPVIAVTDFDKDGNCDYALVLPISDSTEQSRLTIALGDGSGNINITQSLIISGVAYNLTTDDIDQDHILDIVIANGSTGNLEIFLGDGFGQFTREQIIDLGNGTTQTFALGSLDIDRDGNIDFVSGELGGGNLVVAINQDPDEPVISDEMVVFGFSNLDVKVQNPDDEIISPTFSTVAGSDYQTVDINGDGLLDERTMDYNLQYGEYTITYYLEPDASDSSGEEPTYAGAIGIDGSQQATIFINYDNSGVAAKADTIYQADSLVFYYTVEEESSIQPPNGYPVVISRPVFDWSMQVSQLPPDDYTYHFQLDRYYDFRAPLFDSVGLIDPEFQPMYSLGNDSVYYWHYRVYDGTEWSEYSRTFAVLVTDLCCLYSTGNVNSDPNGEIDINDAVYLIGYLLQGFPRPAVNAECNVAGNVNGDDSIDISDAVYLVNYVLKGGPLPGVCP